jgi:hypothetical protein
MINTKQNIRPITVITLSKNKMWSLEGDRRGDVISCMSGTLWVTQEGDLKDYIVESGRNFWVTKPGTVVVQALDDSKIKYSLNEMQNHIENNHQPIHRLLHSRVNRLLR